MEIKRTIYGDCVLFMELRRIINGNQAYYLWKLIYNMLFTKLNVLFMEFNILFMEIKLTIYGN